MNERWRSWHGISSSAAVSGYLTSLAITGPTSGRHCRLLEYSATGFVAQSRLGDSSRESCMVAEVHEQTHTLELQDHELARI